MPKDPNGHREISRRAAGSFPEIMFVEPEGRKDEKASGFLSRAEGCSTFRSGSGFPRSSVLTARRPANSTRPVAHAARARAGSFDGPKQSTPVRSIE
jgi:hypothetical protein